MSVDYLAHPEKRHEARRIGAERAALLQAPSAVVLEDFPVPVVFVNGARQLVWANRAALALFELPADSEPWGLRVGEAFGCVHARGAPDGCGTAAHCALCGAAHGMAHALLGEVHEEDYLVMRGGTGKVESLDLSVWSKPFEFADSRFAVLTISDISASRRRDALERVFYHDILNTAHGLRGLISTLSCGEGERRRIDLARSAAEHLVEEIESQRSLQAAEDRSLTVDPVPVEAAELARTVIEFFRFPLEGKGISLEVDPASSPFVLLVDRSLLRRVLVNMVKNAIEASTRGDRVLVGYGSRLPPFDGDPGSDGKGGSRVHPSDTGTGPSGFFWTVNRAPMERTARERVFERAFSTKGRGRGFGTYGMRLIAERYLGGRVAFSSEEGSGTRFTVELPLLRS
ncbi:MAG: HAMP domain-containing histidine kinase [Spirochaetales bacterium]|nr:HAMP domain-containing histidine kinase [Spirochaetales bacterium]